MLHSFTSSSLCTHKILSPRPPLKPSWLYSYFFRLELSASRKKKTLPFIFITLNIEIFTISFSFRLLCGKVVHHSSLVSFRELWLVINRKSEYFGDKNYLDEYKIYSDRENRNIGNKIYGSRIINWKLWMIKKYSKWQKKSTKLNKKNFLWNKKINKSLTKRSTKMNILWIVLTIGK